MYSHRLYKILENLCFYSTKYGASILCFDKTRRTFFISKDPKCVTAFKINYNLGLLWAISAFVLLIKYRLEKNWDFYYVLCGYYCCGLMAGLCCSILRWRPHDFCIFANASLSFYTYFQRTYMANFKPSKALLNLYIDIGVVLATLTMFYSIIFVGLYCTYDPRGIIFLGALIPDKYYSFFPLGIIIIIYHIHTCIRVALNLAVTSSILLIHMWYFTILYTNEFNLGAVAYKTEQKLRSSHNVRVMYRSFQLLHQNVLCFVGSVFALCHFGFTLQPTIVNFVLMRYWKEIRLFAKLPLLMASPVVATMWMLTLQLCSSFFTKGEKSIKSWELHDWGSKRENKIMNKFRRSCKPVIVCYGSMYQVKRITPFAYVKTIIRGSFKSMLALRKIRR